MRIRITVPVDIYYEVDADTPDEEDAAVEGAKSEAPELVREALSSSDLDREWTIDDWDATAMISP